MAPTAGGQHHWTAMLAPRSINRLLSYIIGWSTCLAWQAAVAWEFWYCGVLLQGLILTGKHKRRTMGVGNPFILLASDPHCYLPQYNKEAAMKRSKASSSFSISLDFWQFWSRSLFTIHMGMHKKSSVLGTIMTSGQPRAWPLW